MRNPLSLVMICLLGVLAACAPAAAPSPTVVPPTAAPPRPQPTITAAVAPSPTMESASSGGVGAVATSAPAAGAQSAAAPAWLDLPLVDARTGATFTLAEFSGKTVLARAMAQWCTNCRNGQRRWRDEVLTQINPDNVVFVTLDIETNSTTASLASYAESNNFPWVFAVATPELVQALSAQFGSTVLVPPSEPQWIIRPDGSVGSLISDRSTTGLVSLLTASS
ncbi:MAG: hypothetical protein SF123_23185 [Chloroflexota bacterium]|nr:hypothetical protein [Chloroflexota bacterium]